MLSGFNRGQSVRFYGEKIDPTALQKVRKILVELSDCL